MPEKNIKIKVSLTIFAGILIFLIFILMIGTDNYLFSKTYNLNLYLDDATGLVEGAPVTLGGYKVGDVESVEFIPTKGRESIKIRLRIQEEYQNRITVNSHAKVSSIGILGDKFINISVGLPEEPELNHDDTLHVIKSLSLENITSELSPGISNLNNLLKNLSLISDTIAAGKGDIGQLIMKENISNRLEETLVQVNNLLIDIQEEKGTLGKLIYNDSLYSNLANTSEEISDLLTDIRNGKGTLGKLVADDSLYNNLNSASSSISYLLEEVNKDSSVVNGLLTDKELYKQLLESIQNINNLVKDIKTNPDRYINVSVF
jgi:phospholipid/cholesterol/gamma-HCH transport system substrate-binding protein